MAVQLTQISIHAPARGATQQNRYHTAVNYYFNPRSREGSDKEMLLVAPLLVISIHAPARGATENVRMFATCQTLFQSTLPRGERPQAFDIKTQII